MDWSRRSDATFNAPAIAPAPRRKQEGRPLARPPFVKPDCGAGQAAAASSAFMVGPLSLPLASTSRSTNSITASGALSP